MARIEGEQYGHTGRVREWLARAVNAPRDPAWTADGVVSDRWAPVSPVTGALDAFRWRVPVEEHGGALLAAKVEALAGLGAGPEPALEHAGTARDRAVEVVDGPVAVATPADIAIADPTACGCTDPPLLQRPQRARSCRSPLALPRSAAPPAAAIGRTTTCGSA
jgi:HemY protein